MPITFTILAGATPIVFSTGCCGTCDEFYHRSYLAGGCRAKHRDGELSVTKPHCEHWKLKDMYKSAVQHEIEKVKL